jgi:hypothetical protein
MTFEEKRKLSAHMASLPGEKLVAVLDIISESEVGVGFLVSFFWSGKCGTCEIGEGGVGGGRGCRAGALVEAGTQGGGKMAVRSWSQCWTSSRRE